MMFFLAIEKYRLIESCELVRILFQHALMDRIKAAETTDATRFRRLSAKQSDIIRWHARESVVGMEIQLNRGVRAARTIGILGAGIGDVVHHLPIPLLRHRGPTN